MYVCMYVCMYVYIYNVYNAMKYYTPLFHLNI